MLPMHVDNLYDVDVATVTQIANSQASFLPHKGNSSMRVVPT